MTSIHLTKIVPDANQKRFYRLDVVPGLFGDWGLVREWGRIGRSGQVRTDWFSSKADAAKAGNRLAIQKGKRGYQSKTEGGSFTIR